MIKTTLFQQLDSNPYYQDALAKVKEYAKQKSSRFIIGIAGIPGSGKSTLADYLADRANLITPGQVLSVSMDGFHFSKAQLNTFPEPEAAFARRGAPWTFDSQLFCETLAQFKQAPKRDIFWPSFDHAHGDPIENDVIIPASTKILIVEGLYVLHQDHGFEGAQQWIDESWFIDLDYDRAMQQLIKRHQQAWGFTESQARQRIEQNDGLNAQIAAQSKTLADFVLPVN